MTTATETTTYPRRSSMLGRATDQERAKADRLAAEKVAAYQANPTAETLAALTPDPAVWHPFCDAGKVAVEALPFRVLQFSTGEEKELGAFSALQQAARHLEGLFAASPSFCGAVRVASDDSRYSFEELKGLGLIGKAASA